MNHKYYSLLRKICRANLLTSVSKCRVLAEALEAEGLVRLTQVIDGALYAKPTAAGRELINQF